MSDIDLAQLDRPLGEYPDAVIGAIQRAFWSAPHTVEFFAGGAWIEHVGFGLRADIPYRIAPEPRRPMTPRATLAKLRAHLGETE